MIVLSRSCRTTKKQKPLPYSRSSFLTTLFHLRVDSDNCYYDSLPLSSFFTSNPPHSSFSRSTHGLGPRTHSQRPSSAASSLFNTTSTTWASFLLQLPTLPHQPPAQVPSLVQSTLPPSTALAWPPPRTAAPPPWSCLSRLDQTATSSTRPRTTHRSPTPSVSRSAWSERGSNRTTARIGVALDGRRRRRYEATTPRRHSTQQ